MSALFGEIRLAEPGGSTSLLVLPGTIWWPDVPPMGAGTTVPVTLINTGGASRTVGTALRDELAGATGPSTRERLPCSCPAPKCRTPAPCVEAPV